MRSWVDFWADLLERAKTIAGVFCIYTHPSMHHWDIGGTVAACPLTDPISCQCHLSFRNVTVLSCSTPLPLGPIWRMSSGQGRGSPFLWLCLWMSVHTVHGCSFHQVGHWLVSPMECERKWCCHPQTGVGTLGWPYSRKVIWNKLPCSERTWFLISILYCHLLVASIDQIHQAFILYSIVEDSQQNVLRGNLKTAGAIVL